MPPSSLYKKIEVSIFELGSKESKKEICLSQVPFVKTKRVMKMSCCCVLSLYGISPNTLQETGTYVAFDIAIVLYRIFVAAK